MVVTYNPSHSLLRHGWHGTVLPDVWKMCCVSCSLALLLCNVYNPIRQAVRDGGKKTFLYYVFHDCDAFFALFASFVTFILAFFNSTVFARWWKLRELMGTVSGRTVDTTMMLASFVGEERELHEQMRLLWLAHALHVASVHKLSAAQAEGVLAGLVEQELLKPGGEYDAIERCVANAGGLSTSTPFAVVYGWFLRRFTRSLGAPGAIVAPECRGAALQLVQGNLSVMRSAAADVLMYLSTPVPLAYTHLLEVTVTTHVLIAPLGLVPRLLWMAVPGCFFVTLTYGAQFGAILAQLCGATRRNSGAILRSYFTGCAAPATGTTASCASASTCSRRSTRRATTPSTPPTSCARRASRRSRCRAPSGRATPTAAPTAATATAAAATRWSWWRTPRTRSPPRAPRQTASARRRRGRTAARTCAARRPTATTRTAACAGGAASRARGWARRPWRSRRRSSSRRRPAAPTRRDRRIAGARRSPD